MIFATGSRVKFIHTGYTGKVTAQLGEDMVSVLLDDGDEIPAFLEDLERIEATHFSSAPSTPVKAKVIKYDPPKEVAPDLPEIANQYHILKPMGLQLAFEAVDSTQVLTSHYKLHLINDTQQDFIVQLHLMVRGGSRLRYNDKLAGLSVASIGELPFDDLNDYPQVDIDAWPITTMGSGPKRSKSLKIKPKQFFKKVRTAPLLNKAVHHYRIFESDEEQNSSSKKEDLKDYTIRKARRPKYAHRNNSGHIPTPADFASFIPEIDLHIEKLHPNHARMNNAEILRLQIQQFENFIEQAYRMGIDRVFIIHGLGKGKLRNSIASRLIQMPEVETFKNEYHPKYGYGATEVIFNLNY